MSHFVVTVCLPDEKVQRDGIEPTLANVLAPFYEGMEVEPYRDYEKDSPTSFWWTRSVMESAESYRELTGVGPNDPVTKALDDTSLRERARVMAIKRLTNPVAGGNAELLAETDITTGTEAVLRKVEEWRKGYEYSLFMNDMVTWPQVIELYKRYFDNESTEEMFYDEELDRMYTMSTYNPASQWDWYVIGGRWKGRLMSTAFAPDQSIVHGQPGSLGTTMGNPPVDAEHRVYCDGGQVHALDFEYMRTETARKGLERFDAWQAIVDKHGMPQSWQQIYSQVQIGTITMQQARAQYNEQPAIKEARGDHMKHDGIVDFFDGCPVQIFGTSRKEFEQQHRNNALVGYALVTLGGEWTAPGKMGWFGISSDGDGEAEAFKVQANKYIDALAPDSWIVNVDCHI